MEVYSVQADKEYCRWRNCRILEIMNTKKIFAESGSQKIEQAHIPEGEWSPVILYMELRHLLHLSLHHCSNVGM